MQILSFISETVQVRPTVTMEH